MSEYHLLKVMLVTLEGGEILAILSVYTFSAHHERVQAKSWAPRRGLRFTSSDGRCTLFLSRPKATDLRIEPITTNAKARNAGSELAEEQKSSTEHRPPRAAQQLLTSNTVWCTTVQSEIPSFQKDLKGLTTS